MNTNKEEESASAPDDYLSDLLNSDCFFCYTCSALEEWDCVCEDEIGFDEDEIYHDFGN